MLAASSAGDGVNEQAFLVRSLRLKWGVTAKRPLNEKGRPEGRPFPYAKAQTSQNLLISRCSAWMRRTVPVTER